MSRSVPLLDQMAIADRLDALALDLTDAARRSDLEEVSRIDHAIRNAAVALIGSGGPDVQFGESQRASLTGAIDALDAAAASLVAQKAKRAALAKKSKVYLAYEGPR